MERSNSSDVPELQGSHNYSYSSVAMIRASTAKVRGLGSDSQGLPVHFSLGLFLC